MAAPEGNKFWLMRTKHGRDKLFESPAVLLEACLDYFEQTSQRVWEKTEYKGADIVEVKIPTSVPFTLSGLCIFLDIDDNTWFRYRKDEQYKDFWDVTTHVEKIIYTQKFEGAVVGAYNANIIARDLGLADKTETKTDVTVKDEIDYSKYSDDELRTLAELQSKGRISKT